MKSLFKTIFEEGGVPSGATPGNTMGMGDPALPSGDQPGSGDVPTAKAKKERRKKKNDPKDPVEESLFDQDINDNDTKMIELLGWLDRHTSASRDDIEINNKYIHYEGDDSLQITLDNDTDAFKGFQMGSIMQCEIHALKGCDSDTLKRAMPYSSADLYIEVNTPIDVDARNIDAAYYLNIKNSSKTSIGVTFNKSSDMNDLVLEGDINVLNMPKVESLKLSSECALNIICHNMDIKKGRVKII